MLFLLKNLENFGHMERGGEEKKFFRLIHFPKSDQLLDFKKMLLGRVENFSVSHPIYACLLTICARKTKKKKKNFLSLHTFGSVLLNFKRFQTVCTKHRVLNLKTVMY